jgi:uncharacterized protein (DUF3820 family)
VTNLIRGIVVYNLSDIWLSWYEKAGFHATKGGDVMRIQVNALDIPTMFSLVVLALYAFVLGYIFL